jgi:hypothetical protein
MKNILVGLVAFTFLINLFAWLTVNVEWSD